MAINIEANSIWDYSHKEADAEADSAAEPAADSENSKDADPVHTRVTPAAAAAAAMQPDAIKGTKGNSEPDRQAEKAQLKQKNATSRKA